MDEGSGLIRGVELTPANVADTDVADALIMGDEEAVYADKAYESKERRKRLRTRGIGDGDIACGPRDDERAALVYGGGIDPGQHWLSLMC